MSKIQCKNCDTEFSGKYCPECGQNGGVRQITFRETMQDFNDTIFSVDAPLLYTLKMLFVNPGKMLQEFLSGKRKRYYKPVAFFVLMTILYLIIRALVGFDPLTESAINAGGDDPGGLLLKEAQTFMFSNINKLLFLFVLWLGLLLKLFYFKRYSLAEYWTVSFYIVGIYIILTTLNIFIIQYLVPGVQFGAILLIGLYFLYAFLSFFEYPKGVIFLKTIPIFIISTGLYIASAFGLSVLIVWLKQL